MDNNIFNNIVEEAKVKKEDIFKLASSGQNAHLRDATGLRQLSHQVALMA
ncbi:stage VI sporulation protein F, partial [Bacillus thuringiensis]